VANLYWASFKITQRQTRGQSLCAQGQINAIGGIDNKCVNWSQRLQRCHYDQEDPKICRVSILFWTRTLSIMTWVIRDWPDQTVAQKRQSKLPTILGNGRGGRNQPRPNRCLGVSWCLQQQHLIFSQASMKAAGLMRRMPVSTARTSSFH